MQTLHIQLAEVERDCVELRYFIDQRRPYEPQVLNLATIEDLIKLKERNNYMPGPDLKGMGQRLFFWLDGDRRWLSRAISNCPHEGLILAIDTDKKLTHLPWEVLHDDKDFLAKRVNPVVVPVRWINLPTETKPIEARPLRVLFMATSPEGVEPVLDFEREEARILEATQDIALDLQVEESGCIAELGKVWSRYIDTFDVLHLTGHASIPSQPPYTPYLIAETETGDRYEATAEQLAEAFQFRWPQLVFLSGCRTGQAADNRAVPSMAEALIQQGAKAVLSWDRPVADVAALSAAHLYRKLADGYRLPEALASTYQHLLKERVTDWHLLRLYVRGKCAGAFVEPLGNQVWLRPEPAYDKFLDPATQQVRVASPQEFIGRRRTLQRCLKALRTSSNLGVLIHGMGGVGKSTVTAQLLERMAGYHRIFVYRGLDEAKLLRSLSFQCTSKRGQEILQGKLPLLQRLTLFLQQGLLQPQQRFVFVLDDVEANLEVRVDGVQVIRPAVVDVLMALLKGIANSKLPHRAIITCRYDFQLPELNHRLHREPLAGLRGADLRKKCDRLSSFNLQSEVALSLQERAKKTADGNPRLLEWLDKILPAQQVNHELILEQMEKAKQEFRENILAEELLKQQPAALRKMLGKALVYELPVPQAAIAAICADISNLDTHIHRASVLGLLEVTRTSCHFPNTKSFSPIQGEESASLYRVPRILEQELEFPTDDVETLHVKFVHQQAAQILHRLWWEEAKTPTEEQELEIHRLAFLGKEAEIAAKMADVLAGHWKNQSRFREAVQLLLSTLDFTEDYRILHQLARSEQELGEINLAQEHYQKALFCCRTDDEEEKAAIIYNLASMFANQGEIEQAIAHYQQSLELFECIGNVQGQARTLGQLANIYSQWGQVEKANALYQQSLGISNRIGDVHLIATTLHQLAGIYAKQGEISPAISYYQQSIVLFERIGDIQGQAATVHQLAIIYTRQGEISSAIAYYQQSLILNEHIGNLPGKAATLHQLAGIYANQGEIEQAIACYQQSLELEELIGNLPGKAATLAMVGQLLVDERGDFDLGLDYLQQSLEIFQQIKSDDAETVQEILAKVLFMQFVQRSPEAQQLLQQMESADEDTQMEIIARIYRLLDG